MSQPPRTQADWTQLAESLPATCEPWEWDRPLYFHWWQSQQDQPPRPVEEPPEDEERLFDWIG